MTDVIDFPRRARPAPPRERVVTLGPAEAQTILDLIDRAERNLPPLPADVHATPAARDAAALDAELRAGAAAVAIVMLGAGLVLFGLGVLVVVMSGVAAIDLTGFRPVALSDQPAPQLIWVPVAELVIDRSYQREVTAAGRRMIQRIADGFDWTKFGALQLAPLEGGRYAITDGQHRAHAAALCGVETVPAMVIPMSARQQAQAFAAMNRDRIAVDALAIYRAELAAGADWAVACRDAVAAAGCTLMSAKWSQAKKRGGQVFAVNLVRRMVAAGEGDAVTAGLAAIRGSIQGPQPAAYSGVVLAVWLPALAANQRFLRLDLSAIFDGIDFHHLLDDCRRRARQTGGSARGMAIEYVTDTLRAYLRDAA